MNRLSSVLSATGKRLLSISIFCLLSFAIHGTAKGFTIVELLFRQLIVCDTENPPPFSFYLPNDFATQTYTFTDPSNPSLSSSPSIEYVVTVYEVDNLLVGTPVYESNPISASSASLLLSVTSIYDLWQVGFPSGTFQVNKLYAIVVRAKALNPYTGQYQYVLNSGLLYGSVWGSAFYNTLSAGSPLCCSQQCHTCGNIMALINVYQTNLNLDWQNIAHRSVLTAVLNFALNQNFTAAEIEQQCYQTGQSGICTGDYNPNCYECTTCN